MSCDNECCRLMNKVPTCANELILGTVMPNTDYWIYVDNLASNYSYRQSSTSDAQGLLSLDLTLPGKSFYMTNYTYNVRITEQGAYDIVRLEIQDNTFNCITIPFYTVNGNEVDTTITLTLA